MTPTPEPTEKNPDMNTPFTEKKLKEFDEAYAPVVGMHDYERTRHDARRDFLEQAITEAQRETAKEIAGLIELYPTVYDKKPFELPAGWTHEIARLILSKYSPETNTQEPKT